MFWMCINGDCVIQPGDAEAGGLWHAVIKTPRWAKWKWVLLCPLCIYSHCPFFLLTCSTKNMVKKQQQQKKYLKHKHWRSERKRESAAVSGISNYIFQGDRPSMWLTEECVHGVCIVSATGHCTTRDFVYLPNSSPCHIMVMKLSAACSHFWPMC